MTTGTIRVHGSRLALPRIKSGVAGRDDDASSARAYPRRNLSTKPWLGFGRGAGLGLPRRAGRGFGDQFA